MSLCGARLLPVGLVQRGAGILQEGPAPSIRDGDPRRPLSPHRNGLVFDLASGSEVVFTRSTAGTGREHSAWVDRCAALASIRHPHLVELVDYGLIGVAHRFEALGMPSARRLWPARDAAAQAALRSVVSFLHERRMSAGQNGVGPSGRPARQAGPRGPTTVQALRGHTLAMAQMKTPGRVRRKDCRSTAVAGRGAHRAWPRVSRRSKPRNQASPASAVIRQITEILDTGRPGWWRCLHVRAAPGVGLRSFVAVVAREARLRGFVPVAVGALGRWAGLARLLAGVHLLLIDEVPEPGEKHEQEASTSVTTWPGSWSFWVWPTLGQTSCWSPVTIRVVPHRL